MFSVPKVVTSFQFQRSAILSSFSPSDFFHLPHRFEKNSRLSKMSGSDIRDILQIGAPTEPLQRKTKTVEKRPGAIQLHLLQH